MRGIGEPNFEHDLPPETDVMREMTEVPYAQENLELELAARLAATAGSVDDSGLTIVRMNVSCQGRVHPIYQYERQEKYTYIIHHKTE
jgi:hypothetical protein